jgi:hypothetical protein
MYKISEAYLARSEEVLRRVKEERNTLETMQRRKAHWIGHIVRTNCLLKHVFDGEIEGRIKVTRRYGRIRKQLLDNLEERQDSEN